jgi:hypothetical protein
MAQFDVFSPDGFAISREETYPIFTKKIKQDRIQCRHYLMQINLFVNQLFCEDNPRVDEYSC